MCDVHGVDRAALHKAAAAGSTATCVQLLDRGADINATDMNRRTPLAVATYACHHDTCKALLARGADPKQGRSPLTDAAANGMYEICALLLDLDVHVEDGVLHTTAQEGHVDVCALLLERGVLADTLCCERTALFHAVLYSRAAVCRLLLRHGANVNARDAVGQTPLDVAGEGTNWETLSVLLDAGARRTINMSASLWYRLAVMRPHWIRATMPEFIPELNWRYDTPIERFVASVTMKVFRSYQCTDTASDVFRTAVVGYFRALLLTYDDYDILPVIEVAAFLAGARNLLIRHGLSRLSKAALCRAASVRFLYDQSGFRVKHISRFAPPPNRRLPRRAWMMIVRNWLGVPEFWLTKTHELPHANFEQRSTVEHC